MKASDNPYPSLLLDEVAVPPAPASGQRLFVDPADHQLKARKADGSVGAIGGGGIGPGTSASIKFLIDPFTGGQGYSITKDATNRLIAGGYNGDTTKSVVFSTDDGAHWTPTATSVGALLGGNVTLVGYFAGRLFAFADGSTGDLYAYSDNDGATWTTGPSPLFSGSGVWPEHRHLFMSGSNLILMGAGGNVGGDGGSIAFSSDNGATWTNPVTDPFVNASLAGGQQRGIYDCVVIGSRIWIIGAPNATTANKVIAYSDDDGATWSTLATDPLWNDSHTFGMSISGVAGLIVATAATFNAGGSVPHGIAVSTDGGTTWTHPAVDPTSVTTAFGGGGVCHVIDATHAIAFSWVDDNLYFSTDAGVTWTVATGLPASYQVSKVAVSADATTILAGGYSGLALSGDSGATWTIPANNPINGGPGWSPSPSGSGADAIEDVIIPYKTGFALAGGGRGYLGVSLDDGATWDWHPDGSTVSLATGDPLAIEFV